MYIPSSSQVWPLVHHHLRHHLHNSLHPNISGPPTRSTSDHLHHHPRGPRRLNSQPSSRNNEHHRPILLPFVFHILFSVFCCVSRIWPDAILLVVISRCRLQIHFVALCTIPTHIIYFIILYNRIV